MQMLTVIIHKSFDDAIIIPDDPELGPDGLNPGLGVLALGDPVLQDREIPSQVHTGIYVSRSSKRLACVVATSRILWTCDANLARNCQ